MIRPQNPGTGVDARRYQRWLACFSGYRNPVTQALIEFWLQQFKSQDRDLAARILDSVLFIGHQHIHTTFRGLLEGLEGWHSSTSSRRGRWFFVPFSGSTGESGDSMVHAFRQATSMTSRKFNSLFIHRSELVSMNPAPEDTVVLLDDFSGSGKQACDSWNELFSELLTGSPRVFLMLAAATSKALAKISEETEMQPVCGTTLMPRDDLFSSACNFFSDEEKQIILKYCKSADGSRPKGFGECGLLFVLAHKTPNNSIPILHANNTKWTGLFPRHG